MNRVYTYNVWLNLPLTRRQHVNLKSKLMGLVQDFQVILFDDNWTFKKNIHGDQHIFCQERVRTELLSCSDPDGSSLTLVSTEELGCPCGLMVKAMNCGIVVREFVLQSRYYVHFRANTLGKGMNPLILPPAMGK